jgi:hypothetical protein
MGYGRAWLAIGVSMAIASPGRVGLAEVMKPVPFVGCRSDGQMGPQAAPRRAKATPKLPSAYADRLAFYAAADGPGVLAPRGWRCFGLEGSNGVAVIVTPEAHGSELIDARPIISGPAVELYSTSSETSGRFEVARVAAGFFPSFKDFVRQVAAEGIEEIEPSRPGPRDQITLRTATKVEFTTPAGQKGLGTRSRLKPSGDPIRGAYVIDPEGLTTIHVRLPASAGDLAPLVIREAERLDD